MSRFIPPHPLKAVPVDFFGRGTTNLTWTSMPAASTELVGATTSRVQHDMSGCQQMRLAANIITAGFAGSKLSVQYSLDDGATWFFMDGTADGDVGAETPQIVLTSTGYVKSAWMTIAAAARTDVLLRIVGDDGNGVASPAFARIRAECR